MTELSTHVFELDLTSVCVNSGIVQLPMKMQAYFLDGAVEAKIDGEVVPLEFQSPRKLGGFKGHFEKRGLNANDRVRFELEVDGETVAGINASCIKRERNKPAAARTAQGTSTSADTGERDDDDETRPQPPRSSVGESGSWGSETSVRAVRRVTIRGSDTVPQPHGPSHAALESTASNQRQAAEQRQGELSAGSARWRPLDGLSPAGEAVRAAEIEFSDTTVRAIRRRRVEATAADRVQPALDQEQDDLAPTRSWQEASEPAVPASAADPEPSASERVRLSDLLAPAVSHQEPKSTAVSSRRPRIFAGRGPRAGREASGMAWFAPSAPNAHGNGRATASPDLIEERELVPVARQAPRPAPKSAALGHTTDAVENRQPRHEVARSPFERSLATNRDETPLGAPGTGQGSSLLPPVDAPAVGRHQQSETVNRPLEAVPFRAEHPYGSSQRAPAQPVSNARPDQVPRSMSVSLKRSDQVASPIDTSYVTSSPVVNREPLVSANTDFRASNGSAPPADKPAEDVLPATPQTIPQPTLQDDIAVVSAHLDRPETPAIVRSDLLADQLGLEAERCERALERLSERRDRITRIRKGAYMIRRDATRP